MSRVNPDFVKEIEKYGEFNAAVCFNCGNCTAICPMGIDILPRTIFRHALIGLSNKIIDNEELIFSCLLCKLCEATCPREVPIAENIRSLRHYINRVDYKIK